MRKTLVEVLGAERGGTMYTQEWLKERVLFHLDPEKSAEILLAELKNGCIAGHFIVRVEQDSSGDFGYGSTIYVEPEYRRLGIARALLEAADEWMLQRNLTMAFYNTAITNSKLISLFCSEGYELIEEHGEMVRLRKSLNSQT